MSNQDDERMALKSSQYSNTPSINDGKDPTKLEPNIVGDDDRREAKSIESNIETNNNNDSDVATTTDVDHQVIRSESVIRSPSKSMISSPTPVIQVVDTSSQNSNSESISNNNNNNNNDNKNESTKKSHVVDPWKTVNVASQASSLPQPSQQSTSATNYFLQPAQIAPNNPFLRAASFQSSSASNSDNSSNSESNSESEIVFAPPKLIPSSFSNKYETKNFLHPSILKTSDTGIGDLQKPSETISTSKTFISLNKEDIGTIKTPAFIKNTTLNISNGNTIPLGEDVKDPETTTERPKSTFLFGQKLEDRVVFDSKAHINNDLKTESSKIDHLISFSDVTKCEETINNPTNDLILADNEMECSSSSSSSSTLVGLIKNGDNSESVFKRKYEVITGEEDEQNVLTIYGKLYAWDTEKKSWVEKGRGHLRLNDVMKNDKLCSRLVMRTAGALRLILNAHIVFGMTFELANENCLRFTYVDGIYLIKANPKDIDQLHSAIEHRLRELSWKRTKASSVVENNEDE